MKVKATKNNTRQPSNQAREDAGIIESLIYHPFSIVNGVKTIVTKDSIGDNIILTGSILENAAFYYNIWSVLSGTSLGMPSASIRKIGTLTVNGLYFGGSALNSIVDWRKTGKVTDSNLIGMGSGFLGALSVHDSFSGKFAGAAAVGLATNAMAQEKGSTVIWDFWGNEWNEHGKSLAFQNELEIYAAQEFAYKMAKLWNETANSFAKAAPGASIAELLLQEDITIPVPSRDDLFGPLIHLENGSLAGLSRKNSQVLENDNTTDLGRLVQSFNEHYQRLLADKPSTDEELQTPYSNSLGVTPMFFFGQQPDPSSQNLDNVEREIEEYFNKESANNPSLPSDSVDSDGKTTDASSIDKEDTSLSEAEYQNLLKT